MSASNPTQLVCFPTDGRSLIDFVKSICLVAMPAVVLLQPRAYAEDWPRWLGPQADGVWREEGILQSLPASGLKTVWEVPVQGGYSGPAVADGRLFVMDFIPAEKTNDAPSAGGFPSKPGTERVLCFDAATGNEIWSHSYKTDLQISYPGGPRSTCFVDGESVYAQGTMGELLCLQANDGEVVWEINVAERYETKPPLWGYASHPLVYEESVICAVGGEGSGVVAFDKKTGQEKWKAVTAREIGYAPLAVHELQGKPQLVVWYDVALVGLNPNTGEELWKYDFPESKPQRPIVSIVPPHVVGDQIFISNYYHGSALVQVTADGVSEIWSTEKQTKHDSDINSIMSTVIHKDGFYYGVSGSGEIRCVSEEDASMKWYSYQALLAEGEDPTRRPRGTNGFPSLFITPQEDHYWLFTDLGDLIQAKLNPDGYEELGRTNILEPTGKTRGRSYVWCAPAFSDGFLFVRNEAKLICLDMNAASYESSN
ncbi:MAG: PQQ-binding-like beta-propeller repeat protein [Planctomycetota bacterium]